MGWAIGILGLFVGMVAGAYAWFHAGSHAVVGRLRLESQAQVEGYRFVVQPVSRIEQQILASTNLINGVFQGKGAEYRVFLIHWEPGSNMSVVQHTPDICWMHAGWKPAQLGQPNTIKIDLGERSLAFECRAFVSPDGGTKELVVWCTLIDGRPCDENYSFQTEGKNKEADAMASPNRTLAANQFWQSVIRRVPGDNSKQFVRFSTELRGDWQSALGGLQSFGAQWLRVRVDTP